MIGRHSRVNIDRSLIGGITEFVSRNGTRPAQAKDQEISYLALSECPIRGDTGRIRHILDNLLSNASKYTPSGGRIHVVVAMREIDGKTWSTVTVSDSGPGVPSDSVGRVFDEFYRVPSLQDVAPGAGIGLSVSRRVARLMGGEVTLNSTELTEGDGALCGASFTLRLPPDGEGQQSRSPERRAEA